MKGTVAYNDGNTNFMKGGRPYEAKDAHVSRSRLPGDGAPRKGKAKGAKKGKGKGY